MVSWKSLINIHPSKPKNHYKTIQDKFLLWSNNKIFEKAYKKLIVEDIIPKYNNHSKLNLYIDSSDIHNDGGVELTATGKNKKKKVTKVSYVCDENKTVYSISFYKGNEADVKTIVPSINPLIKNMRYRRINLVGEPPLRGVRFAKLFFEKYLLRKLFAPQIFWMIKIYIKIVCGENTFQRKVSRSELGGAGVIKDTYLKTMKKN